MPAQSCVHRHELTSLSLDYKALTKAIAKKIEPELPKLIQAKQVEERKSNWTKCKITKYLVLVNSQLRLFLAFDWLKNSDYEPIVGVLRHMENLSKL